MNAVKNARVWLAVTAILGCCSLVQAGEPIRFIRAPKAGQLGGPGPGQKVERDLNKILDSLETPNPFDGMSAPLPDRGRGRGSDARRAQMARAEREKWLWYDEDDLHEKDGDDKAVGGRYEVEDGVAPGEEKARAGKPRRGSGERQTEGRESNIPAHLLSPQTRQKILMEAAAERRLRDQEGGLFRDSSDPDQDISLRIPDNMELGKLLSTEHSSGAEQTLRELAGSRGSSSDLGSSAGSELLGGRSRFDAGSGLDAPRAGSSIFDRDSSSVGLGSEPSRWGPAFRTPDRSVGSFPSLNSDLPSRSSGGSSGYQPPREIPDYAVPRRR